MYRIQAYFFDFFLPLPVQLWMMPIHLRMFFLAITDDQWRSPASAVPSRLEASIIPTSRRSEMTMMRVLFLGFTDWGAPKKPRPKDAKGYWYKPGYWCLVSGFLLWSYVSGSYSILDRRLWKRHWNFQTSRGVNVISRDSKPRCQSGTIASEHIIWYCEFINVYLGACISIWRMQALAFVTWLLPKRTLPTMDDLLATIRSNELRWISIISTEDSKQQCANQSDMLHVSFNCFRSHDYICLFGIYLCSKSPR